MTDAVMIATNAILDQALNHGADSPVDYGDAEQLAKAVIAALVSYKGGLVALWDDLAARKAQHFPVRRLKPFNAGKPKGAPITFGQLIAGAGA